MCCGCGSGALCLPIICLFRPHSTASKAPAPAASPPRAGRRSACLCVKLSRQPGRCAGADSSGRSPRDPSSFEGHMLAPYLRKRHPGGGCLYFVGLGSQPASKQVRKQAAPQVPSESQCTGGKPRGSHPPTATPLAPTHAKFQAPWRQTPSPRSSSPPAAAAAAATAGAPGAGAGGKGGGDGPTVAIYGRSSRRGGPPPKGTR